MLLVAPNERKVRIETGYGARLPDRCRVERDHPRNAILPRFKAGDYGRRDRRRGRRDHQDAGASAGRGGEAGQGNRRGEEAARRGSGAGFIPVIVMVFFVIIGSIAAACRREGAIGPAPRRDRSVGRPVGPRRDQPLAPRWRRWLGRRRRFRWRRRRRSAASPAAAGRSAAAALRGDGNANKLSEDDHAKVSAAIAAAEAKSDGEIVAIATDRSDAYHDVGAALGGALVLIALCSPWAPAALLPDLVARPGPWRVATEPVNARVADLPDVPAPCSSSCRGVPDPQMDAAAAGADAGRDQDAAGAAARDRSCSRRAPNAAPSGAPASSSICRWASIAPRSSPTRRSRR